MSLVNVTSADAALWAAPTAGVIASAAITTTRTDLEDASHRRPVTVLSITGLLVPMATVSVFGCSLNMDAHTVDELEAIVNRKTLSPLTR